MKKTKRKPKKILFFFIGFIILWIIIGTYLFLRPTTLHEKLKKIGYSTEEILTIETKLEDEGITVLLQYDYHKSIAHILKEEDFQEKSLNDYLDFLFQYKSADAYDIVFLVNHNQKNIEYTPDIHDILTHASFKEENLERYLAYYQKYELDGNQVVIAVNQNLDEEDIKMDETIALFLGKDYALTRNLERYLTYYEEYPNLDIDEIITRVNSNLDKTFYQDITATDLEKGNLVIVNKYYYLDSSYVPDDLVTVNATYGRGEIKEEAYNAFIRMYNDAAKEGLYLYISSPYRSYQYQTTLYTNYVNQDGQVSADTYSARPGFSEHQTGLAMDLGTKSNPSISAFASSKEFIWVSQNSYKYGFILRYPEGKEYITGYIYEPWHYRYVGVEAATYIYEHNITYEEYYEYFVK